MIRLFSVVSAVVSLCLIDVHTAGAQVGPLIDWIHKLSGPQFVQPGVKVIYGYEPGIDLDIEEFQALARELREFALEGIRPSGSPDALSARAAQLTGVEFRPELVHRIQQEVSALRKGRATLAPTALAVRLNRLDQALTELETDLDALDPGEGVRARLSVMAGKAVFSDDVVEPDSAAVNIITFSPTVEYLFTQYLGIEAGVSVHHFHGDFDEFWNVSFPVRGVIRPFARQRSPWARAWSANAGVNIFMPFREGAFAPVSSVNESGVEVVLTAALNFDVPFWIF